MHNLSTWVNLRYLDDIWCRDMDTDQTSTEQTCGRTDKNGKKYAQHHIQRQKDQHLGQGEDKSHRYNQHCKKNEMVLGRAYQPPQRRPMDLACHQLETIWQEKTTRETSQAMERRPGQILERHDMAEESTRQGSLETACWGLRPTTGHNGCLMMMMMTSKKTSPMWFDGGLCEGDFAETAKDLNRQEYFVANNAIVACIHDQFV